MDRSFRFRRFYGYLAAACVASMPGLTIAQQVPTPPKTALEFFNPIQREHAVTAICGSSKATLKWTYDGRLVTFSEFQFKARIAPNSELRALDEASSALNGDIFVRLECNIDGAGITIIGEKFAATRRSQIVRFDFEHGALSRKY